MNRFLVLIHNSSKYFTLNKSKLENIRKMMITNFGINNRLVSKNSFESILIATQYFSPSFTEYLLDVYKTENKKNHTYYLEQLASIFADLLEMETIHCSIKNITSELSIKKENNVIGYIYLGDDNVTIHESIHLKNGDVCLFQETKNAILCENNITM